MNESDLLGRLGGSDSRCVRVAPADLVALRRGTELALLALGGGFEGAAAAHFLENAFAIELGFKPLESPIDGFVFFQIHSTHASFVGWLYGPYLLGGGFFSGSVRHVKSDRSRKLEKCVIASSRHRG